MTSFMDDQYAHAQKTRRQSISGDHGHHSYKYSTRTNIFKFCVFNESAPKGDSSYSLRLTKCHASKTNPNLGDQLKKRLDVTKITFLMCFQYLMLSISLFLTSQTKNEIRFIWSIFFLFLSRITWNILSPNECLWCNKVKNMHQNNYNKSNGWLCC